jgi:hypothetical protein
MQAAGDSKSDKSGRWRSAAGVASTTSPDYKQPMLSVLIATYYGI